VSAPRSSSARWLPWALLALWWGWKGSAVWSHLGSRHYATWGVLYDAMHMHWMSWWTGRALTSPELVLFESPLIDFPAGGGTDLDNSLAAVHAMLAGLLRLGLGAPAAHNLVALAGLAAALVAAFLLLRRLAGHGLVAAGMAILALDLGLCWERTLPDLDLAQIGWLCFALWAWLRWADRGRWRDLALATALTAFTAFTQMYYGLALLLILATASLLSLLGLGMPGIGAQALLRRTPPLLGLSLGLALLLHMGNITSSLSMYDPSAADRFAFTWWEAGLFPLLVAILALVAAKLGSRGALLWSLLALPLAVLAMGETVQLHDTATLSLPLQWLKTALPFLHRLSFCFRFVPSLTLCLAAALACLVPVVAARGAGLPGWARPWAPALPALALWLAATVMPIPRMETGALTEQGGAERACTQPYPAACSLVERRAACPSQPSDAAWTAHKQGLGWYGPRALSPLLPLHAVAMPAAPFCAGWLAEQPAGSAILELSTAASSGYSGYLQTFHGQPVVSTPSRSFSGAVQEETLGELARWALAYRQGGIADVPDGAWLAHAGLGFVVLYAEGSYQLCQEIPDRPLYNQFFQRPDGAEEDQGIPRPGPEAFAAAYGEPVCQDALMWVYRVSE
jgi:hypothetical protein